MSCILSLYAIDYIVDNHFVSLIPCVTFLQQVALHRTSFICSIYGFMPQMLLICEFLCLCWNALSFFSKDIVLTFLATASLPNMEVYKPPGAHHGKTSSTASSDTTAFYF